MPWEARVEFSDGTTSRFAIAAAETEVVLGETSVATIAIDSAATKDTDFAEHLDEVYLEDPNDNDEFGGDLVAVERGEDETTLSVPSFEQRARDAPRTAKDDSYAGVADTTPVNDAIGDTPTLSAGTVENVASDLTFVFSRTSQAKKLRTVAEATGGELAFNADKTVDYVASRGSDKTATTITRDAVAGDATAVERFRVRKFGSDEFATHLKMLGASRGAPQREATIVPADDGGSYVNKATYSSSWSSGDRKIWKTYANKDQVDVSTLQTEGIDRAEALNTAHQEVETLLNVSDVELGDEYTVQDDRYGIDQSMRVVERRRRIEPGMDLFECVLSTRSRHREKTDAKAAKDVERYNSAFEGDLIRISEGPDRQVVTSSTTFPLKFFYPANVEHENRIEAFVSLQPYRAFSGGAASSAPAHTHDVDVTHPSHDHSISTTSTDNADFTAVEESATQQSTQSLTGTAGAETIDSFSPASDTTEVRCVISVIMGSTSTNSSSLMYFQLQNTTTGTNYPPDGSRYLIRPTQDDDGSGTPGWSTVVLADPTNCNGETLDITIDADSDCSISYSTYWAAIGQHTHDVSDTSTAALGTTTTETSASSSPAHTHDPDPGLTEFGTLFPSNVDVIVNGTSQGTSFGDGSTQSDHTVDLRGTLNSGAWNTVECDSDATGHIILGVSGTVYVQDTGQ